MTEKEILHLLRNDRIKEARACAIQLFQRTGNISAKTLLAETYLIEKNFVEAKKVLDNLPPPKDRGEKNIIALGYASYYFHQGNFETEQLYIAEIPNHFDDLVLLFSYYSRCKNFKGAEDTLARLQNFNRSPKVIQKLEEILFFEWNTKLQRIESDLNMPGFLGNQIFDDIYININKCIENIPHLKTKNNPDELDGVMIATENSQIVIDAELEKLETLIIQFCSKFPNESGPQLLQAFYYETIGNYEKAQELYDAGMEKHPTAQRLWYNASIFYAKKLFEYDSSIYILKTSLEKCKQQKIFIRPRYLAITYNSIAHAYSEKVKLNHNPLFMKEVKRNAKEAIKHDETYAVAHAMLAHYYAEKGKPLKAIAEFERARQLDPSRFEKNHGQYSYLHKLTAKSTDIIPQPWHVRHQQKLADQKAQERARIKEVDQDGFTMVPIKSAKARAKATPDVTQVKASKKERYIPAFPIEVLEPAPIDMPEKSVKKVINKPSSSSTKIISAVVKNVAVKQPKRKSKSQPISNVSNTRANLTASLSQKAEDFYNKVLTPAFTGGMKIVEDMIYFYNNTRAEDLFSRSLTASIKSGTNFFKAAHAAMPTFGNDIYASEYDSEEELETTEIQKSKKL